MIDRSRHEDQTAKRHAPATERNREPICSVLAELALPAGGKVLEVAAGTGEHAVSFARAFPRLFWLPTDADRECLASIAAYRSEAALPNLLPAIALDAAARPWPALPAAPFAAVVAINLIHIAPWAACVGLMAGAAAVTGNGGRLVLYGAFRIDGRHTAPSNAVFDATLKAMDPRFGIRDVAEVAAEAAANGFVLERRVAMPANNFTLVFVRGSPRRA